MIKNLTNKRYASDKRTMILARHRWNAMQKDASLIGDIIQKIKPLCIKIIRYLEDTLLNENTLLKIYAIVLSVIVILGGIDQFKKSARILELEKSFISFKDEYRNATSEHEKKDLVFTLRENIETFFEDMGTGDFNNPSKTDYINYSKEDQ